MKRRTVLKQAGAMAGTIAAAGCLSDGGGAGGDEEPTEEEPVDEETTEESTATETATETETPAMSMSGKSIETTDTGCGSESSASVSFTESGASIEGSLATSDPCHDAVFADVAVDGDAVTVVVEAVPTDADACQQCLGQISYAASVETKNGAPQSMTVEHRSQGETTTAAEASR